VNSLTVALKLPALALRALPTTHTPSLFPDTVITFPTPGAEVAVNVAPGDNGSRSILPLLL
jgi:hypothetical protein